MGRDDIAELSGSDESSTFQLETPPSLLGKEAITVKIAELAIITAHRAC